MCRYCMICAMIIAYLFITSRLSIPYLVTMKPIPDLMTMETRKMTDNFLKSFKSLYIFEYLGGKLLLMANIEVPYGRRNLLIN